MKTMIVLLDANHNEARNVCELIEGTQVANERMLMEMLNAKNIYEGILLYTLSDFITSCNDQEIDLDACFMSYVIFKDDH